MNHGAMKVVALLIVLLAQPVFACSGRTYDENELIENKPVWSANGRFAAVVRQFESIPDFKSERAGKVLGLDNPVDDENRPEVVLSDVVTTALYESGPRGRALIREIPIEDASLGDVLVSDSGRYVVAVQRGRPCRSGLSKGDPLISVYASNGARGASLKVEDVFEPYDLMRLSRYDVSFALRHESEAREVVVVSILIEVKGSDAHFEERLVDVATGELLGGKRPIFPAPRVYVTPANSESAASDCAANDVARIDSQRLFEAATFGPLPPFPDIPMKARIRGTVQVEVLISESGDVLCAHPLSKLLFGLDTTAAETLRGWKFKPFLIDGHAAKVAGELLVHFRDVDDDTWREIERTMPRRE